MASSLLAKVLLLAVCLQEASSQLSLLDMLLGNPPPQPTPSPRAARLNNRRLARRQNAMAMMDPFTAMMVGGMGGMEGFGMGGGMFGGGGIAAQPDPYARMGQITTAEEQMAEVLTETGKTNPDRMRMERVINQVGGKFTGDLASLNYIVQDYWMTTPGPVPPPNNPPPRKPAVGVGPTAGGRGGMKGPGTGTGPKPGMGMKMPGSGPNPGMGAGMKIPGAGLNPGMGAGMKIPGAGPNPGMGAGMKIPGAGPNPGMGAGMKIPGAGPKPGIGATMNLTPGAGSMMMPGAATGLKPGKPAGVQGVGMGPGVGIAAAPKQPGTGLIAWQQHGTPRAAGPNNPQMRLPPGVAPPPVGRAPVAPAAPAAPAAPKSSGQGMPPTKLVKAGGNPKRQQQIRQKILALRNRLNELRTQTINGKNPQMLGVQNQINGLVQLQKKAAQAPPPKKSGRRKGRKHNKVAVITRPPPTMTPAAGVNQGGHLPDPNTAGYDMFGLVDPALNKRKRGRKAGPRVAPDIVANIPVQGGQGAQGAPAGTTVAPQFGDVRYMHGFKYVFTDADGFDVGQWVKEAPGQANNNNQNQNQGQEGQGQGGQGGNAAA